MSKLTKGANIYFRGMNLSGGAPRSSFGYLDYLKKEGHRITVVACEKDKNLAELYKNSFDRFISAKYVYDYFAEKKFIDLYLLLKKEYEFLKKDRPDLVIILGYFNSFFYSRFCNSLGIPAVTLIAGGDLSTGTDFLKDCTCDHVICFSEENRDVLLKCVDDERITVISNRIQLKTVFDDAESHYNLTEDDCIDILFTSRVSGDKYDSIIHFIGLADKVADEERKINLAIAGDGDCFVKLKEYTESINNPYLTINLKGHVDNLVPEFEKAHIVVGKGRSVIEPIMMNRIGCVMGDDGKIEVCTTDNFENLYHYNFSGRNLNCDNPEAVLKNLIDSMISGTFDTEEMKTAADLTRKHYSSEHLAEKFNYVLDNLKCEKQRKKRVSVLLLVLKMIRIKVFIKIKRGMTK